MDPRTRMTFEGMRRLCRASPIRSAWILVIAVLAGTVSSPGAEAARLRILTSFVPLYAFTVNVATNVAEVTNLLPPGVGPHDYQLTPGDVRKINRADVIIMAGLGLDDWLTNAIAKVTTRRPPAILQVGNSLKEHLIEGPVHHHHNHATGESGQDHAPDAPNPHFWLDPKLAASACGLIRDLLVSLEPSRSDLLRKNAADYEQRLLSLDRELQDGLRDVRTRPFLTYHDAFPYFARRYELNLAGVIQDAPDISPSPRRLQELLGLIREKSVRAIFTESQTPKNLVRQIAADAGIAWAELGTLETGPLSPHVYETVMRDNLLIIQRTLK